MNTLPGPPIVLVHGAWHGAWCWSKLLPRLREGGRSVLAPDLPGHGEDVRAPSRLSLKHYARAIADQLETLETPCLLVGHSMGGMVISLVADLVPRRIGALVYLAAFLPRDGDSVFSLMAENAQAHGASPIEACMRFSADRQHCSLAPSAARLLYRQAGESERQAAFARLIPQATLPLGGKVRLRQEAVAAPPRIYLRCLADEVLPLPHQNAMLARQPCERVLDLDSDHSPFLSQPESLATLLSQLRM